MGKSVPKMAGRSAMTRSARKTYAPLSRDKQKELDDVWELCCDEFLRPRHPPILKPKDRVKLTEAGHGLWATNTE